MNCYLRELAIAEEKWRQADRRIDTAFHARQGANRGNARNAKELVDAYEQASRTWLARVKSEVEFWSDLTTKLGAAHSAPEALETYQKSAAQRMQMAADDGRRLSEDCQDHAQDDRTDEH